MPPTLPPADYASSFDAFFGGGPRMTSVYKPLLLRALLDATAVAENPDSPGEEWVEYKPDGRIIVKLDFVAMRMTRYCWDMHRGFRLRQSQAGTDADIVRVIAKYHGAAEKAPAGGGPGALKSPQALAALAGDACGGLRAEVIRRCIKKQVLWRLQVDLPGLYEMDGGRAGEEGARGATAVILGADAARYMRAHRQQIRSGLNHVLATYLEKINTMTPRIASKVDHDSHRLDAARRHPLAPAVRKTMIGWQGERCFYCERPLGSRAERPDHVDHVVPFRFVYSTHAYNCVVACQGCNCAKSNKLPERGLFKMVLDRNDEDDKRGTLLARAVPGYTRKSYDNLFDACKAEYNGGLGMFSP